MFPEGFLWGVSASGFQFEMGGSAKGTLDPNTDWFKWVHDSKNIEMKVVSGDLPEEGVNYWELYKKDHDIAKNLGMNAFRIGVEWSRIFPKSTAGVEVGVEVADDGGIARVDMDHADIEKLETLASRDSLVHYRSIIEDLIEKGFRVIVCLNHFTLPLWIHDPIAARDTKLKRGPRGWYDRESVVEFSKYAAFVAWALGDVVDIWSTFNEPMVVPEVGYLLGAGGFPPGLKNEFGAFKRIVHNMATAHARAFDLIKRFDTRRSEPTSADPAWVGIIHNVMPMQTKAVSDEVDVRAAEFMDRLHNTYFIESITSGWLDSNLNGVRDGGEVKPYLGRRLDWLGVNYYTRIVVRGKSSLLARVFAGIPVVPDIVPGYGAACERNSHSADGRPTSDFGWEMYPEGIAQALLKMAGYGRPMYITENGVADTKDELRPRYIVEHLRTIEALLEERRVDLRGYLHWALTDNYEWAEGFRMHFGLFAVDLKTKERLRRGSAEVYRNIIESGTTSGIKM